MNVPAFSRLALAAALFAAGATSTPALAAETFPDKPLLMIIPQGAGGGSDTLGRFVAERLGNVLGEPIVVENRPGAAGVLGADIVKRADPDGYTLLLGAIDTITAPLVNPAATLNAVEDFEAVSQLAQSPNVWVLSPSFEGKSMTDLVRIAKERPNEIDFASSGVGSMQHLGGELLNQMAEIELAHVPYKGGPAGFADVIGGRVPAMLSGFQGALAQVRAGAVVPAAVTDSKRWEAMPDVPTAAEELGMPDYVVMNWQGLFLPANTPSDRVNILANAVAEVMSDPETRTALERLGYEPIGNTPAEFSEVIRNEQALWSELITSAGIQAE